MALDQQDKIIQKQKKELSKATEDVTKANAILAQMHVRHTEELNKAASRVRSALAALDKATPSSSSSLAPGPPLVLKPPKPAHRGWPANIARCGELKGYLTGFLK
jgi:hypothetical protein